MSNRFIREISSGGIEIAVFKSDPGNVPGWTEVDATEIEGKNPDKCRINVHGKVYEDPNIITKQELNEQLKNKTKGKLKVLGLTDEEISAIIK